MKFLLRFFLGGALALTFAAIAQAAPVLAPTYGSISRSEPIISRRISASGFFSTNARRIIISSVIGGSSVALRFATRPSRRTVNDHRKLLATAPWGRARKKVFEGWRVFAIRSKKRTLIWPQKIRAGLASTQSAALGLKPPSQNSIHI